MTRPIAFNLPEGKSADEFLDAQYLELLNEVFEGVKQAFGDDAILYRIDIGRIFESAVSGELIIAGQFVDKSDGEVFNFEINQGTNKLGYKSSSEFLSATQLAEFLGESVVVSSAGHDDNQQEDPLYPYDLLIQAINDEDSEVYQSPFSVKLRLDIDYLGVLSLAMYRGAVSVEAQPLYAALHGYVIKYALGGLKLFSNNIRQNFGGTAGEAAEQWVEDHGVDFSAAVIKDFSARRYTELEEQLESGSTEIQQLLTRLIEDAIDMAFATTKDLIEIIATSNDYQPGDIKLFLTHAINEYCPIDNSDGYTTSESAKQLADIWKQLLETACCPEDLSVRALGLPSDNSLGGTSQDGLSNQQEDLTGSRIDKEISQSTEESSLTEDARGQEAGDNIYYVNVGEGLHRNWDDCRKFGFLAAGGGRKWSKQLEKIKIGDTVIAYLKGHGYVGIGNVTSEALPATKFSVDGVPIRELPLVNDTIRSIKRFSNENGEYLIGVDWQVAVPREQAAWKTNAGLFTTALVCASLKNQQQSILFAKSELLHKNQSIESTRLSNVFTLSKQWKSFSSEFDAFLKSYCEDPGFAGLEMKAEELLHLCPVDLSSIDEAKLIRNQLTEDRNASLLGATSHILNCGDIPQALFFIGLCELGDKSVEIFEQLLELIEDNGSLDGFVTNYTPHNVFQVNALVGLLYWTDLPDWARALLVIRSDIGFVANDRDSLIDYLGTSIDNIGRETLLAISTDAKANKSHYTEKAISMLKSFLAREFDKVSEYNGSFEDDLLEHYDEIGEYYVSQCAQVLKDC